MKRHDENLREVFDRHMPPAPTGALEDAAARVLGRLREGRRHEAISEQLAVSRPRIGFRFAVAAVLIMTVAIGVYAFRAQRMSRAQVASSSAQDSMSSGKATAEITGVALLLPGSRKPEAAPSREEILRGVAAQIAAAQATDVGAIGSKFAAASIRREYVDDNAQAIINCGGVDGQVFPSGPNPAPQGRCIMQKMPLDYIMAFAFQVSGWGTTRPVVGIPNTLLEGPRFQIQAVAENPARATKAELLQMFQNLLMERFKLRIHRETRQVDGWVLTVAKSGIKLKETSTPELSRVLRTREQGPGPVGGVLGAGPNAMVGQALSTEDIARNLVAVLNGMTGQSLPVIDKTGVKGLYDIRVEVRRTPLPVTGGTGARGDTSGGPFMEYDPPLPKAFEEQLGLVLTRTKVPIEYILVDHIEAPTEN